MMLSYYFLVKSVINFSGRCFGWGSFCYFITTKLVSKSLCSCTRKDKLSGQNESKELELEKKNNSTFIMALLGKVKVQVFLFERLD